MPLLKTHIAVFVVLTIITFASLVWIDRYQQIGPDVLTGHWGIWAPGKNWADASENELALFSTNPQAGVSVQQPLPAIEPGTVLLFSAEVKCDHVVRGKKPWNLARVVLVQNDGQKDLWNLPLILTAVTGTQDWTFYRNFFYITTQTRTARVIAELHQSTGSLQVRNMQLYPVHETEIYLWVKNIILFSWGGFFLLLVGSCLFAEKRSMLFRAILAGAFISIVIGTSLPGYLKTSVIYEVEAQIDDISPVINKVMPWELSKLWHACVFLLLGSALALMIKKAPLSQLMTIIIMMAAGTEMMQLFIDGRSPLVSDVFIDAAGGIVGIYFIRRLQTKPSTERS
ncbi:MAG: VanZ family protein [Nitrosomonas sp.]|nr:VanZ family protein [Nitrosomonas sp.]